MNEFIIDNNTIDELITISKNLDYNTEVEILSEQLKKSKYDVIDLYKEEQEIDTFCNQLNQKFGKNFLYKKDEDGNKYKIKFNLEDFYKKHTTEYVSDIKYYIGVNPKNMYKLVKILCNSLMDTYAKMSFQTSKSSIYSNRIVISTNLIYKNRIDDILRILYMNTITRELLTDGERVKYALYNAVINNIVIPNVYIAKDNVNICLQKRLARVLIDAKNIMLYLNTDNDNLYHDVILVLLKRAKFIIEKEKDIYDSENKKNEIFKYIEENKSIYYKKKSNNNAYILNNSDEYKKIFLTKILKLSDKYDIQNGKIIQKKEKILARC